MIILLIAFSQDFIINFYLYFELRLVPIFLLVIGWGYQPERIIAGFMMFFYTFLRSLPLLLAIIILGTEIGGFSINFNLLRTEYYSISISFFILIAFIVKLPVFFFHSWLPKAHVEAPVSGSIILAGLILKLGGLGILFVRALLLNSISLEVLTCLSMIGGLLIGGYIISCSDIKVMIAYSSVAHISLVRMVLLGNSHFAALGGLFIIVSHGYASSGIFALANIIYEARHTRRFVLNKGVLSTNPPLAIIVFLIIVLNFGGPFTINLLSELIIISYVINVNYIITFIISSMCFFALGYNLVFYATIIQGVILSNIGRTNISSRHLLLGMIHIYPALFILISSQL